MSFSKSLSEIITERYNSILFRDLGLADLGKWEKLIEEIIKVLDINPDSLLKNFHPSKATEDPREEILGHILNSWAESHGPLWKGIVKIKKTQESTPYKNYNLYTIQIEKKEDLLKSLSGLEVWERKLEIEKFMDPEDPEYLKLRLLSGKSLIIEW